jgi:hypothetical protein
VYGVAGGLLVGVPAYFSVDFGVGSCGSKNCFAPIAATVGAVTGFLIGAEKDSEAARRWVAGPSLDVDASAFEVPLAADYMVALTPGVALLGEVGLARATAGGAITSTHAARGLLSAVGVEEHQALIASAAGAILAFDEDESVRGARRVFGEGGSALATDGGSRVVVGGEGTLRLVSVAGTGNAVSVTEEVAVSDPGPARSIVWAGNVIWELAGRRVIARSPNGLVELGSTELSGPGRSLAVFGGVGVVAGGEAGVTVLDLSDPSVPFITAVYEGVRYAFDVELSGREAYVTAGEQGLVRLDLTDPTLPVVTAVIGNLGLPYAVVRSGDSLYVLDREDRRLHVIDLAGEASAGR